LLCAIAAACAVASLAGWVFHADALKTLLPGHTTMKANTSLSLLALALAHFPSARPGTRVLQLACASAAAAVALATLAEYAFGWRLGIDEGLFADPQTTSAPYPGRPSPATMVGILSLAAASLVLGCKPRWCAAAAHWLAGPGAAIGALALIGYAFGADEAHNFGPYVSVAFGTTLALCALAAAILIARPRESWARVLYGRPATQAVFARLLPASFVLPVASGLLVLAGVRAQFYAPIFGISLFAVLTVAAFIALSWETASVASRVEGALQRSNAGLLAARLRAEQATRAKSVFLAGMSHELRTPLHAILGYAELLASEGDLRDTQLTRLMSMLSTGRHLLETVNSVLAMSEIEAGGAALSPSVICLRQLAADCIDLVRPNAEAKGLTMITDLAPDLPPTIMTDAIRLRQILVNLLGNAVKFTDRGSVTLRLRQAAPADPAGLLIEIADTGRGIPAARRGALFREFERLGIDRESRIEGAGLGLAISARLAALLGGEIAYAENPGGGSIFALSLKLAMQETSAAAATLPPSLARTVVETTAACTPRRVLIVDDVEVNREIASAFLCSAGHTVIQAATGESAVGEAARQDFDVILMDVRMGEMDGFEATRRIRALGGARQHVPIVAMTAHVFADQIEACGRAGMDFHLPKPFDRATLLAAVERAADRRGAAADAEPAVAFRPVIDMARFETIGTYLPAEGLARYLQRLSGAIQALAATLGAFDRAAPVSPDLADAVHALAGKAGMLGFTRLAATASLFEHSARTGEAVPAVQIQDLMADLGDALDEAQSRLDTLATETAG
jgi:signal transduction histidine kinase/DNA-binding NarL/FixJ family response regulator